MKSSVKFLVVVLICLSSIPLIAQQSDTLEMHTSPGGKIKDARFKPNPNRKIEDGSKFLQNILAVKQGHEFRLVKETKDDLGVQHQRYAQYWNGVKLDNAEYLVHGRNGLIESINGDYQEIGMTTSSPAIDEKAAITRALSYVGAKKYKWEDAGLEKLIKENKNDAKATYYPKGELVFANDRLKRNSPYLLSWKFTISSLEP